MFTRSGIAHAQSVEGNEEEVGAARLNLGDILKINEPKQPSEQNQGAESTGKQAAAPMGTGNTAGGTAGEMDRQGAFFGNIKGEAGAAPQETGAGGVDVESTEAGGAAVEAAAIGEQNEAEEEEQEVIDLGEQNEEDAAEMSDQNEELEGEEVDIEATGGVPVVDGGDPNEPFTGTVGNNLFFAVNGGEGNAEGEAEMVGGDSEAEIGAAGVESGEVAHVGAMGGTETAESGDQVGGLGKQEGADVESTDKVDASSSSMGSAVMTENPKGGEIASSDSTINEEVLVKEAPVEIEAETSNTLKVNPLAAKAKQIAPGTVTTPEPMLTTAPPKIADEEGEKESGGISDANKIRIAISVSAVGAVVLVGVITVFIGKRTRRRSHTGP